MSKMGTNVIILLGAITLLFGAYYFFTQEAALILRTSESDRQLQQLVQSSQLFVERSAVLSAIELDARVLDFDVFNSLQSYSPSPDEFGVGRQNPFVPTTAADAVPIVNNES